MKVPSRAGAIHGALARPGIGDLKGECPICGAKPGYRCTKTVGLQVLPRAKAHPERRVKRGG